MSDSTNNTLKTKRNNLDDMLDDAVSSLATKSELEDQDAIDKLLVNTGFDTDEIAQFRDESLDSFDDFGDFSEPSLEVEPIESALEAVADTVQMDDEFSGLDDFSDFSESSLEVQPIEPALESVADIAQADDEFLELDDFGSFADPLLDTLPDEELVSLIDEDEEESEQDAIDKLLTETGFDTEITLPGDEIQLDDFDDFGDFSEPAFAAPATEEVEPVIDIVENVDVPDDQDPIDKLLADSGFDKDDAPQLDNELLDDFSGLDDFSDLSEPVLDALPMEELSPIVDVIDVKDEALEQDNTDNLLTETDFDEVSVQQDGVTDDEFSDFPSFDEFVENVAQAEVDDNKADHVMTTPAESTSEFDEDAQLAAQVALMNETGSAGGDEFLALDEIGDDVFAEPTSFETKSGDELEEQTIGRNSDGEDDFLLADFDITADTDFSGLSSPAESGDDFAVEDLDLSMDQITGDAPTAILDLDEQSIAAPIAELAATAATNGSENDALAQLKAEQERMDKQYKKQLNDAEAKAKKAAVFGYVALTTGILALGLAGGMGWLAFSAKSELTQLSESVKATKTDVDSHLGQKPEEDLTAVKTSVEQLNQKLDGVIGQINGTSAPLQAPDVKLEPGNKVTEVTPKKDVVNKSLDIAPTKIADLPTPNATEANPHAAAPADHAAIKPIEHAAKTDAAGKAADSAKPNVEPEIESKNQPVVKAAPENKIAAKKKPAKITKPTIDKKPFVGSADWSVNLIAYKQDWYAKSKAAEFAQKGVPVEVIPVEVNGVTWYRLKVGGFANKAEADAYAARVKKALNLSSVWVGDI
ncbi:MAG: SPOR domain-containing protein [Methylococcales bacterium]|nr:SPOR domain-containing protein [Methylococcales bacterium]